MRIARCFAQGDVNKEPVFMDLNELAKYLASQPQPMHPITNAPLTANNIRHYAFRIE